MTVNDSKSHDMSVNDREWQWMTVNDSEWQWMTVNDSEWQWMTGMLGRLNANEYQNIWMIQKCKMPINIM